MKYYKILDLLEGPVTYLNLQKIFKKFYSREHVGEMWKEFYQGLLKDPGQCRETAKKRPAVKQGQTEEKGVVLWKNRRRQFT